MESVRAEIGQASLWTWAGDTLRASCTEVSDNDVHEWWVSDRALVNVSVDHVTDSNY